MVNALICSGQLSLSAWEPYVQKESKEGTECRASLGAIYGQYTDSSRVFVLAVGGCCFEWVESAPPVSGTRHHRAVGSRFA